MPDVSPHAAGTHTPAWHVPLAPPSTQAAPCCVASAGLVHTCALEHTSAVHSFASTQSLPLMNVMARDEPAPSLPPAEVLMNAPIEQEGHLRVRAVLEE